MKKISLILISLLMVACSQYATNRDRQYLQARAGAMVTVPPPLTDKNLSHFYDLPLQDKNPVVSIAPP